MDAAQQKIEEGRAARNAGDRAGGLRGYRDAVALLRASGEPLRLAHTVRHVADMEREAEDWPAALRDYAEALQLYRRSPETGKLDLANTLRGYALLLEALGARGEAGAMWVEARELYRGVGVQAGVDEAARRVAAIEDAKGENAAP